LNGSADGGFDAPVGSNNNFASLTGFPAISIPMGFVLPGLPIGLQLMCRPRSEVSLLQIAYGYEQYTRHRRPPKIGVDALTIDASNS